MAARQCHHCKRWIEPGEAHDCWTTTETALTGDLPEEVLDAWERLRETAVEFGEQRIYASHSSIMFSRRVCYFFVRPTPKRLEICFFLGRVVRHPQIRSARPSSTVKTVHIVHVRHRDEVEAPLTDWLREAYDDSERLSGRRSGRKPAPRRRAVSEPRTPARTSDRKAHAPSRKKPRAGRTGKRR